MSLFPAIFKSIWALITAVIMVVSGFQEYPPPEIDGENCRMVADSNYYLEGYLMRSQGVTTNGEVYFFSSNFFICKTTFGGEMLDKNLCAIPLTLLKLGCDHIGGISYADGLIYAGIEQSDGYEYSYLAAFDPATLKCVKYVRVPGEKHPDGIPWVAADADKGVIYSSMWSQAGEINVYDINSFEYLCSVALNGVIDRVQGAEVYGGLIYMSNDNRGGAKNVWAVNPETGEIKTAFTRNLGRDVEAEGMTITVQNGEPVFHIIDANRELKSNAHIRQYVITGEF